LQAIEKGVLDVFSTSGATETGIALAQAATQALVTREDWDVVLFTANNNIESLVSPVIVCLFFELTGVSQGCLIDCASPVANIIVCWNIGLCFII
jgi:hypothetical protein